MTNQEAFEAARAGDWIAESFTRSGDVFIISGKSAGYSSFDDCLSNGDSVFYSAFDEADNREAGLAVWDASAKTLTPVEIHASLVGGAFIKGDPEPVSFSNGGTITGTLNATAFNTIWGHVFEKGNPHDTEADQIDQSNENLGDTVQDALNKIAAYVIQLDPDGNSDIDWGDLDGLKDLLDSKAEQSDLEQEILDRIAGDAALQVQIDAIDPDGDSDVDWSDIENKPATYPPSAHNHEIGDVNGLQDALNSAGGTPAWDDITGKPSDFPPSAHGHDQSDIDGLEDRLDSIEGSISSGGGFVEAPDDGKLYGRQSSAWAEVVIPEQTDPTWDSVTGKPTEFPPSSHNHTWDQVTGKPTEFPPAAHNHDGVYQPVGSYVTEAPNDGKQYVRESKDWAEVNIPEPDTSNNLEGGWAYNASAAGVGEWTSRNADWLVPATITLHKTDAAGYEHSFALMTVGDVIYIQAPAGGAEYEINSASVSADSATFGVECISRFGDFPAEGDSTYVTFIPQVRGGSVHIGENAPAGPQEGQQWLETPAGEQATMWIYDGAKWLQMPGSKDGEDGKDGDGADLWTDNGGNSISYSGTVTVTGDLLAAKSGAGTNAFSAGFNAGETNQGPYTVAIGSQAGESNQEEACVALGVFAGQTSQGVNSIAIGGSAGNDTQGNWSVSIGQNAGMTTQGEHSVAIGRFAGETSQGGWSVAIGNDAGHNVQGLDAVAVGDAAGYSAQSQWALAIGQEAGKDSQGEAAIAIGRQAGQNSQAANGIIINSTGSNVDNATAGHIVIKSSTHEMLSIPAGGFAMNRDPIIGAKRLISTLSTLRNATRDETTLEGLRDALSDAIGGIVENLEHEISTMPVEDSQ